MDFKLLRIILSFIFGLIILSAVLFVTLQVLKASGYGLPKSEKIDSFNLKEFEQLDL